MHKTVVVMKTSLVDFHLVERESVEVSVQGAASGCSQVSAMKNISVFKKFHLQLQLQTTILRKSCTGICEMCVCFVFCVQLRDDKYLQH